jgi:hypothetical protein
MNAPKELSIAQLKELHPMPWRYAIKAGSNLVVVSDAKGVEVPMFTMLGLVVRVTNSLAAQPDPQPSPSPT